MSSNRIRVLLRTSLFAALFAVVPMLSATTVSAAASTSANVREAQTVMTHFGIPTGPIDGQFGPLTARGLCAFRMISGYAPSRGVLSDALLAKMRSYNQTYTGTNPIAKISAPMLAGNSTYVIVDQTCQAMVYVEAGHYQKVLAVSTGRAGYSTPVGHWLLGYTDTAKTNGKTHPAGWSCSSEYPDTSDGCYSHPGVGRFSVYSAQGNMYDKRHVVGGVYVHGSTDVPTYPASHGCIRVSVADSDWLFDHVGNTAQPYIKITGTY
jgi:lipoprotein-anchoring transpeptidase ErfK/SrfK